MLYKKVIMYKVFGMENEEYKSDVITNQANYAYHQQVVFQSIEHIFHSW